ncbi:hypothetical protein F5J12DRAFT_547444 [Pisolithus orientalis]|uniref:uncharacterized protein n=1 Tax=Pisolithus orientalis TaxID=936130 RepID=UPI002224A4B6|nr:uncharacterized protein F5J12DRAFT_547444 [Pisolithus orientalis]KAI6012712.1 hypothetical protein F5J12DRAFT_547444 [Pisolithus orientalis]
MSSVTDPEAIINEFVNTIHPAFVTTVVNIAFSASLFTLFAVLLALSTKESRCRAVFRLNVLAVCIVLAMGMLVGFSNGKIVVGQLGSLPLSIFLAELAFIVFPPLLCDSILLTRLFALYPPTSSPPTTLLKIFAFPFCVKCARVVVLSLFLNRCTSSAAIMDGVNLDPDEVATWFFRNPYMIAEWTLQIIDNSYFVTVFLYNLRVRVGSIKRMGGMTARIHQIFYISAANFVFPLIFNIMLIIGTSVASTGQLLVVGSLLLLINSYVTVMGVLCATVWFSRYERILIRNEPLSDDMFSLEPSLRRVHGTGMECGSETVVVGRRFATPNTADFYPAPATDCKSPATLTERDEYCIV